MPTHLLRSLGALVAALACLLAAPRAEAHHVVSDSGIFWVEPMTVVQVDTSMATFDFGPQWRGRWWQTTPALEVSFLERFSLRARVPFAFIQFDDGRGVLGLADMEVSAKGLVWASAHGGLIASAGVGVELPTGVVEDGLGAGHVELAPFLALSSQPVDWLIVNTLLSPRFSLSEEGPRDTSEDAFTLQAGPHGSVLAPHARREVFGRLSVSVVARERLYVTAGVEGSWAFEEPLDHTRIRAEAGWSKPRRWRLSVAADAPLTGADRAGWTTTLSIARMF